MCRAADPPRQELAALLEAGTPAGTPALLAPVVCSSQPRGGVPPASPGPALGAALAVFPALSPSKEGAAELGACIQEDRGSPVLGVPPSERLGGPRCFFDGGWFLALRLLLRVNKQESH